MLLRWVDLVQAEHGLAAEFEDGQDEDDDLKQRDGGDTHVEAHQTTHGTEDALKLDGNGKYSIGED